MPTRYNSRSKTVFNTPGIPTGYDGVSAGTLTIPSVGIEDVDVALFDLFDKELTLQVADRQSSSQNAGMKRVPVVFASGEKWAMLKRGRPLKDRNGTLLLPLITIMRVSIEQDPSDDISGRGINQQTGEIVIKRRLSTTDRAHQSVINRFMLEHQQNLAVSDGKGDAGQLTTLRSIGDLVNDPTVIDGGLMMSDRQKNVFEILTIPSPQFFTAMYEVTVWTQYMQDMNNIIEQLISSFLPQGNSWRIDTSKGYWFVATVENNDYTLENNFDDMAQSERSITTKFTVRVPAYIMATNVPGAPVPVKRHVSSPVVSFEITAGANDEIIDETSVEEPFLGSDDPTLPLDAEKRNRRDQRDSGHTRLYPPGEVISSEDPALKNLQRGKSLKKFKKVSYKDNTGRLVTRYIRVTAINRFVGETVMRGDIDLGGLELIVEDD